MTETLGGSLVDTENSLDLSTLQIQMQFVIQSQMNLAVCSAAGWRDVGPEKLERT